MKKWSDISLFKYQQVDSYMNRKDLSETDKTLFCVCAVFGLTEYELDEMKPAESTKLIEKFRRIFESPFNPEPKSKVGEYSINYDVSSLIFTQYIELQFFFQNPVQHAHRILASVSQKGFEPYSSDGHGDRAEYFLTKPVTDVIGATGALKECFERFNLEYPSLFGLDEEVHGVAAKSHPFNKRYGWVYSAEEVARYEGITNDEAYDLPIRKALGDLMYLKAKSQYEHWLFKEQNKM